MKAFATCVEDAIIEHTGVEGAEAKTMRGRSGINVKAV